MLTIWRLLVSGTALDLSMTQLDHIKNESVGCDRRADRLGHDRCDRVTGVKGETCLSNMQVTDDSHSDTWKKSNGVALTCKSRCESWHRQTAVWEWQVWKMKHVYLTCKWQMTDKLAHMTVCGGNRKNECSVFFQETCIPYLLQCTPLCIEPKLWQLLRHVQFDWYPSQYYSAVNVQCYTFHGCKIDKKNMTEKRQSLKMFDN